MAGSRINQTRAYALTVRRLTAVTGGVRSLGSPALTAGVVCANPVERFFMEPASPSAAETKQ